MGPVTVVTGQAHGVALSGLDAKRMFGRHDGLYIARVTLRWVIIAVAAVSAIENSYPFRDGDSFPQTSSLLNP